MPQLEFAPVTQEDIALYVNRCVHAYQEVTARLPKGAGYTDRTDNHQTASLAYLVKLPILIDPPSFQLYIACIAHAAAIGVIDPVDVGRFCHLAQTAMSAWKLANLIVPAAQEKQRQVKKKEEEAQQHQAKKSEKQDTPLPSNGNQAGNVSNLQVEMALQKAIDHLPRFDVQKQHFHILRNRGHLLPCDAELRDNPLAALHFVRMSEEVIREETRAEIAKQAKPAAEPAPAPPPQPSQAA